MGAQEFLQISHFQKHQFEQLSVHENTVPSQEPRISGEGLQHLGEVQK